MWWRKLNEYSFTIGSSDRSFFNFYSARSIIVGICICKFVPQGPGAKSVSPNRHYLINATRTNNQINAKFPENVTTCIYTYIFICIWQINTDNAVVTLWHCCKCVITIMTGHQKDKFSVDRVAQRQAFWPENLFFMQPSQHVYVSCWTLRGFQNMGNICIFIFLWPAGRCVGCGRGGTWKTTAVWQKNAALLHIFYSVTGLQCHIYAALLIPPKCCTISYMSYMHLVWRLSNIQTFKIPPM